ncbi:hypothetical protein CEE37_13780 [candidate division LCP-89 bacterium B3_LCP]|uniref:Uncharacterized protein n=1 Tax=candidate division LCP-89 bacterium B3_LCP TaxID=2012998 RepID=A0A532URM0_UNCL8|nr:MAG: hypothetical protein CEE37_13780 [candidate division LCP-89 bacterium B3_LCP]
MNDIQRQIYKNMMPAQRLKIAFQLHDFAHRRLTLMLRQNLPNASEREIQILVARRFLGDSARVL